MDKRISYTGRELVSFTLKRDFIKLPKRKLSRGQAGYPLVMVGYIYHTPEGLKGLAVFEKNNAPENLPYEDSYDLRISTPAQTRGINLRDISDWQNKLGWTRDTRLEYIGRGDYFLIEPKINEERRMIKIKMDGTLFSYLKNKKKETA